MSQTEQLNIKVSESGAKGVADMLMSIAKEARAAGNAVKKLRDQVGKGGAKASVAEVKKADTTSEANKAKRNAKRIADVEIAQAKRSSEARQRQELKVLAAKRKSDTKILASSIRTSTSELKNVTDAAARKVAATEKSIEAKLRADARILASDDRAIAKQQANAAKLSASNLKMRDSQIEAAKKVAQKKKSSALAALSAVAKADAREISSAKRVSEASKRLAQKTSDAKILAAERAQRAAMRVVMQLSAAEDRAAAKAERAAKRVGDAKVRSSERAYVALQKNIAAQHKLTQSIKSTSSGLRGLGNQVFFAQRAFAALGGVIAVGTYLKMSDTFQNMDNRIRLVTKGSKQFAIVQARLQKVARETRQSLSATTETYVRLRKATLSSGLSQERLFGVMKTLNQMLAVSGASAIETEQSMRQLSQAFSKGKLDGDEFRSIGENMPDILTALQKSLGVTEGELRNMSEAGKLTTAVMVEAFEGNRASAAANFGKSITTIGQAWQVLKDNVLKAVGSFNSSSGAIGILTKLVILLADNLWVVGLALQGLATYSFAKLTKSAVVFGRTLLTSTIPAMWSYVAALRAGQAAQASASFIGPLTMMQSAAQSPLVKFLVTPVTTSVAQLTKAFGLVGSIGAAAAVAGAAFGGWKLGGYIDDLLGISDAFGNVESVSAEDILAKRSKELAALEKQAATGEVTTSGSSMMERLANTAKLATLTKDQLEKEIHIAKIKRTVALGQIESIRVAKELKQQSLDKAAAEKEFLRVQVMARAEITKIVTALDSTRTKKLAMTNAFNELQQAVDAAGTSIENINLAYARIKEQGRTGSDKALEAKTEDLRILNIDDEDERLRQTIHLTNLRSRAQEEGTSVNDLWLKSLEKTSKLQSEVNEKTRVDLAIKKRQDELAKKSGRGSSRTRKDPNAALNKLLNSINPIIAAQKQLSDNWDILSDAVNRGVISHERAGKVYNMLRDELADTLDPLAALQKANQKLVKEFGMSEKALTRNAAVAAATKTIIRSLGEQYQASGDVMKAVTEAITKNFQLQDVNEADRKREASINSVTESILSRTQALEQYKITLLGIAAHTTLEDDQAQLARLNALKAQYPQVADSLQKLSDGTIGMTDEQEQLHLSNKRLQTDLADYERLYDGTAQGLTNFQVMTEAAKLKQAQFEWQIKNSHSAVRDIRELLSKPAMEDLFITSVANAYLEFEQIVVDGTMAIQDSFGDLISGSGASWEDFTDTLRDSFSSMVDTMLEELTRLLIRMALVSAIKATLGADVLGGPQAPLITSVVNKYPGHRHGGTVKKFAHGGNFQVGGAGGPDTKLVQFMASPGENVHVTNPGQSRLDNRGPSQAPAEPSIVVNNIMDPDQAVAAMSSPQGVRVIKNVMLDNAPQLRRFLNQG